MGLQNKPSQLKIKGKADIVFCFDCTGSMTEIINSVKENVGKLIEGFATNEVSLDWRARCLGYRDFEVDDEYLINDRPFVSTEEELKDQIAGMEAKEYTGGDDPESTLDAIWYASKKSEWRDNCHKVVVVFTDAAAKGVNEKTIADIAGADDDIDVLAQELNVNHIKLFLWGLKDPVYDALTVIPRADVVQLENPEEDYKELDFSVLMSTIGKTVSDLISGGGMTA